MVGDVPVNCSKQVVWGPKDPWCPGSLPRAHSLETGKCGEGSQLQAGNLWAWRVLGPRFTVQLVGNEAAVGAGVMMRARRQQSGNSAGPWHVQST